MRNLGQNNHIVNLLKASAAISFSIFLTACGDDSNKTSGGSVEDQEVIAISDKTISGVSQKGPFVNGSSVTVQELDGETLAQTGNSYEGKIKNDLGEFSVKVTKLASQYALLKANGFYRNEVSGEKSKSQVTLYAFTDLSDRDEVNVNLLTHLEYERSIYLATEDSMSVDSAKKLAEKEVLNSFGINGEFASAEDLNIFGNGDESAALLAISVLMQGDLKEADFTERLNNYAMDIETDGIWNDSITATVIADWASDKSLKGELEAIRQNIAEWKISEDVPDFEKYVNNYWWENYRLGVCNDKREGEVLQNSNAQSKKYKEFLICKNNAWRIASDLEYDTYEQKCDEDGKIIFGNVNKDQPYDCDGESWRKATEVEGILGGCIEKRFDEVAEALEKHYICEKREWRAAKDIEKDTYKWKDGKDADSKYGDVVKSNCYVYEDSSWRSGNTADCSLGLRGCTTLRQDTVGKGSDKVWYKCDAKSWRNVSTYEKDTFGWKDSTDGVIKKGNVTDTVYVFDKTSWRVASNVEATLGGCVNVIADSIGKVGATYYICQSNKWVEATATEYDTYRWDFGEFDGEIRTGQINKTVYYIYETDKKAWRNATTLEKDTYDYTNNKDWAAGVDGEIKNGSVTDSIYVFDATAWRVANNAEKVLGGCVSAIQDSVGKSGNTYYICKPRSWTVATEIQYDTYKQDCLEFGQIVHGNVNAEYVYFCYGEEWKRFYGNESISYGKLVDERDGRIYRTVRIGEQTWMAENLNYADENSYPSMLRRNWCYDNNLDSCEKYGRLYSWSATIDSMYWNEQGEICGYEEYPDDYHCSLSNKIQGICPDGWHLPSVDEWMALSSSMNSNYKAIQAKGFTMWKNGTDEFGFSALPAGGYSKDHGFVYIGEVAFFVTSSEEYRSTHCMAWFVNKSESVADNRGWDKTFGRSVRCIKDEE